MESYMLKTGFQVLKAEKTDENADDREAPFL